jgi:hypothetical protein
MIEVGLIEIPAGERRFRQCLVPLFSEKAQRVKESLHAGELFWAHSHRILKSAGQVPAACTNLRGELRDGRLPGTCFNQLQASIYHRIVPAIRAQGRMQRFFDDSHSLAHFAG